MFTAISFDEKQIIHTHINMKITDIIFHGIQHPLHIEIDNKYHQY